MNLLIVDDSSANLKLLRAQLEAAGHGVVEAKNGLEALEALEHMPADAVISDILMPTMDGFRLCQQIRKSDTVDANIPIVLYTSTYSSAVDRQTADAVGADYYLIKPAPTAAILNAVQEAQRKARQRPAPRIFKPDDTYVLEQYSAALVGKLERRNSELHQALTSLNTAHQEMLELNQSLEARVAQRTAPLNAANKELEAFSYSVSHDLSTPLSNVEGYAQLLAESGGPQLDAEQRGYLEHIIRSTQQMRRMIESFLEFARTSQEEMTLSEIDLNCVLEEAIETLRVQTQDRNIQWRREPLPPARGDATLLRQVFVNLLSNAIKYTRTRDPALIEIGTRKGRSAEVVVFVRDNGVGFESGSAKKVFGVFKRLQQADQFEGSGIGLANAHRIITRLGGNIWAEAAVDRGATFYFSLPSVED